MLPRPCILVLDNDEADPKWAARPISRYPGSFALFGYGEYHSEGPGRRSARRIVRLAGFRAQVEELTPGAAAPIESCVKKECRLTSPTAAQGTASPQPDPAGIWATCPSCNMERKVVDGHMVPHRRWSEQEQTMQGCPGPVASTTFTFSG
jgi:hypothetical protein